MKSGKTAVGPFGLFLANPKSRLLDQVREVIRFKHYSIRTEEAYVHWSKAYILFPKAASARNGGAGDPLD